MKAPKPSLVEASEVGEMFVFFRNNNKKYNTENEIRFDSMVEAIDNHPLTTTTTPPNYADTNAHTHTHTSPKHKLRKTFQ